MRNFLCTLLIVLCLSACAPKQADPDFVAQLRVALDENPELVLEALGKDNPAFADAIEVAFKEREVQEILARFRESLADPLSPALDETRPFMGSMDAPVTVVAYSDFQCPHCAKGDATLDALLTAHPGALRIVYKHGPFSRTGRMEASYYEALSLQSAELALEFRRQAFERQREIAGQAGGETLVKQIIAGLDGVDMQALQTAIFSGTASARVQADYDELSGFGIKGVPIYLVNGATVRGAVPLDVWEQILAEAQGGESQSGTTEMFGAEDFGECLDCLDK